MRWVIHGLSSGGKVWSLLADMFCIKKQMAGCCPLPGFARRGLSLGAKDQNRSWYLPLDLATQSELTQLIEGGAPLGSSPRGSLRMGGTLGVTWWAISSQRDTPGKALQSRKNPPCHRPARLCLPVMSTHGSPFSLKSDTHIHSSVIHNSQKSGSKSRVCGEMNGETEGGLATQWNITQPSKGKRLRLMPKLNEPWRYYAAKWNNLLPERQIAFDSTYRRYRGVKFTEVENRLKVSRR